MCLSKGEETRERIVERAWRLASRDGLSGLSIGKLATELGLSKSGLFAHFGSKEDLELEVLRAAAERFTERVMKPAFTAPRGVARLRKLFKGWIAWTNDPSHPGGCVMFAAAVELDDAVGPPRDFLASTQAALLAALAKAARMAVDTGELRRDLDCEQFAFEMLGCVMAYQHTSRLLRDPKADRRARHAFESLLRANAVR
jgi:AcrR family transcriptional regulator